MSTEEPLIPVFVPPLATMLAFAEQKKGSALTQAEVDSIRDQSACIMMEPADAEKMAESRGYVDVNPANCWADWHRLRVQMTGKGYLPKIILCIPGGRDLRERCEPILSAEKIEHEFRPHDPQMMRAFRASSTTWPEFTEEEFARIERHETVLYVLSDHLVAAAAPAAARSFLDLGLRLLEAGGIAVKCDSSGISHPAARWATFAANADRSPEEAWNVLFHAFVVNPIGSTTDLYTCGMHLLGAPDLIISQPAAKRSATAAKSVTSAAITLFRVFANYLLDECPVGKFASGHTFSIDRDAPRYRLIWEPCFGYAEDNFFFNPFGRWRFTEP